MVRYLVRLLGFLVLSLASVTLAAAASGLAVHFTGEVTYRERIALPTNATLRVALIDLDNPGGQSIVAATAGIGSTGQVPLQFDLSVKSDVARSGGHYGLIAEITADNRVWFRSAQPLPIDPAGAAGLSLIVNLVAADEPQIIIISPAIPAELAVDSLFDTLWRVQMIAGNPALPETDITFSIAPDRRAGGNAGCNNYFTEAAFDGEALSFGALAATRMACAPDVMVQEAALFAAFANVSSYQLDKSELDLLGADGKPLLRMAPAE
ncbi:META domain-containing protein [Devosia sp.]|uniref:META domain-containing protein n=1 Tax=Devosia sp. TaxID=1871048 RepID=UPI003267F6AC